MSFVSVPLSEICDIIMGQAPLGESYNEDGVGLPLIAGAGDFGTLAPTPKKFTTAASKISRADDIILCIRATIGDLNWSDKVYCLGRGVAGLRPRDGLLDKNYLWHFIGANKLQLAAKGTGSTFKQVSRSHIAEWEIPLPSLAEQKRIAAILDKADAIGRKRQQAIQLADDFLRAVFLEMFGDPVTNPKGFKKSKLTDLADVITGFAFKSAEYVEDSSDAVRLCRGVNTLTGYFEWKDTAFWDSDKINGLHNYKLESGDVILAMDRPWISSGLKVCVFPENERDTYLVQRVARIRPKQPRLTDYLYSSILSPAFEKHCCPTETTVPHISPVELKNFEILVPDEKSVSKYHDIVSKLRRSKGGMEKSLTEANNIFSSLSQKAFAGGL